jgi:hypothetical protein
MTVHRVQSTSVAESIHDSGFINVIPFAAFISAATLETVAPGKNINRRHQ